MRRTALLLASTALVMLLVSGVALAVTKQCRVAERKCVATQENDRLLGTGRSDWMVGLRGNDTLKGFGGSDLLYGHGGNDRLVGSYGGEQLNGGPGRDTLQGGPHPDQYLFTTAGWGNDSIIETDDGFGTWLTFQRLSARLIIDMNSDPESPEVRTVAGKSTVNWDESLVSNIRSSQGDDSITGVVDGGSSIEAAGGDDVVQVRDGDGSDYVNCGDGTDTVFFDPEDTVYQCEVKNTLTG